MSEVWRARHETNNTRVAVKIMTRYATRKQAYREAFRREVRAVARLSHPGIIRVLDHGEVDADVARCSRGMITPESPFIVMEMLT